jgi:hypothetical protein
MGNENIQNDGIGFWRIAISLAVIYLLIKNIIGI